MRFLTLLLFIIISGCGGGSSSSTKENTTDNTPVDPLKQFIEIASYYKGIQNLAPINKETLPSVFSYLFLIAPELSPPNIFYGDDQTFIASCTEGGSLTFEDTDDANIKKMVFDNCKDEEVTFNGQATIKVTRFSTDQEPLDYTIIFEDIVFTEASGKLTLKGTITNKNTSTYCNVDSSTFNLLFTSDAEQVFFNNLTVVTRGNQLSNCYKEPGNGISLSGKIYDSNNGYWQIQTLKQFKFASIVGPFKEEEGELFIYGANNSAVQWKLISVITENYQKTIHQINIDENGDSQNDATFSFLNSYLTESLFSSFVDSDGDGLTDVLETLLGLNPQNSSDAYLDKDNDGFSNYDEYLFWGNPIDNNDLPIQADLSVSLAHQTQNYSKDIELTVILNNHSELFNAQNVKLLLTTQSPMKFKEKQNCELKNDGLQLECFYYNNDTFDKRSTNQFKYYLNTIEKSLNYIESLTTAEVSFLGKDIDENNNDAEIKLTREAINLEFDASYSAQESSLSGQYILMLGSDELEAKFTFYQQYISSAHGHFKDRVEDLSIALNIPDFISIIDAQCRSADLNEEWVSCLEGTNIVTNQTEEFTVKLIVKPLSIGHGFFAFDLKSKTTDDTIIRSWTFPIISGTSSSELQSQINNANVNDKIYVDDGIYIGPIDLSNSTIDLISKNGAENTFLYMTSSSYGPSSLDINNSSSVDGFTIANHYIKVGSSGGHLINNQLKGIQYLLNGVHITTSGPLTFNQNFIEGGSNQNEFYPSAPTYTTCPSLNTEYDVQANNTDYLIKIQNNLYVTDVGNDCYFADIGTAGNLLMENNTFIGLENVLWIYPYTIDGLFLKYKIQNNIFASSSSVIYFNVRDYPFDSYNGQIELTNNLFYNVEDKIINLNNSITESTSFEFDPLLSVDWSLMPNSPAIDKGFNNDILIDYHGNNRIVDGNHDGVAQIDLGAIEYSN